MKRYLLCGVLFLVLAGCQPAPTGTNDTAEVDRLNATERSGSDPPQNSGVANVTPREQLERFLQMQPSFKATYDVVTRYRDERRDGEETVIIRGNNSVRKYRNESLYVLGDDVYLCQDRCYRIPQEEPPRTINPGLPQNATVGKHSERRIAGVDSTCFTISYLQGEILDCRSQQNGVLTRYEKETSGYSFGMRASSVSDVPADAFDLPSTPLNFSRMPGRGSDQRVRG